MRNTKGQFIQGHKSLTDRDKTTGKFIKISVEQPSVEERIDQILKEIERKNESD